MSEIKNPLDMLAQALIAKHQGQELSPEKVGRLITNVNKTDLGNCENAQALLASLIHNVLYSVTVQSTSRSTSAGYED